MKTSLLTIALAVATMPMMFAKQATQPPATPSGSTAKPAVTSKKHTKKTVKKTTAKSNAAPAAAAKPAAPTAPPK